MKILWSAVLHRATIITRGWELLSAFRQRIHFLSDAVVTHSFKFSFSNTTLSIGRILAAHTPVFKLPGGNFEVFIPCRDDTLHRWGEIWRGVDLRSQLLHAKFHPVGAEVRAWAPKLINLWDFGIWTRRGGVCFARFLQNIQNLWAVPPWVKRKSATK